MFLELNIVSDTATEVNTQQNICVLKQKNVFLNYFSERSKQHIAKLKNASQAI
jgi:hypothetical protein